MDIPTLHEKFLACNGVSTDTRKIGAGAMFFAIRGERFDANTFAGEALEKGAGCVVIDNPGYQLDARTILVKDSLAALQALAAFHRQYLGLPVVALTGSNGKTTTKELIQAVLSQKFRTAATVGNLNNHIGVPLTLLSFTGGTEIGIVEMGANHQKEIEFLCGIARPDYGYITNFGKAHLEGFGGVQGVIKGKSELYDYLRGAGKMAIVNLDDPLQAEKTAGIPRFTFAQHQNADVRISDIAADPFVRITADGTEIRSALIGIYNAANIAAAAAIGKYFKVPGQDIRRAIEAYVPANNRSQLIRRGTGEIILDAYNANPSSMSVAIENLLQLPHPGKLAILGDMFELGAESLQEHQHIVRSLLPHDEVEAIFIGKDFYASRTESGHLKFFESFEEAADYLRLNHPKPEHSQILIKGSRGMALERVLEFL